MGAREFQVIDKLKSPGEPQPELSRNEYLRLLSAQNVPSHMVMAEWDR